MKIYNLKNAQIFSGGKAYGLAYLIKNNIPVPNGFVIEESENVNFNEQEKIELNKFLSGFDKNKKLVVRSSASAEDGKEKSFAGVFETVLNVENDVNKVIEAIAKVNASANSDVVKTYTNNEKQKMNVIIQEMIEPKLAGVLFTTAIDTNGDDVILIECVEGLADKLVSGATAATRIIAKITENAKLKMRIDGSLCELNGFNKLLKYVLKIKKLNNQDLDMEWCIDKNNNVYFVQARPITSKVFINESKKNNGIVASRGYTKAQTFVINENWDDKAIEKAINNFPEGAILVAGVTETLYMPAIKKASGIITEEGSALSHAAIVSRELGIPCITGYKNAINLFPTGTLVTLDANNSKIIVGEKESICNAESDTIEFGELYCFDNYILLELKNTKYVLEQTYNGLMLHMESNDIAKDIMDEIELFVRKTFKCTPEKHFNDKFLWYIEIERFKKLPYFCEICDYIKELAKSKSCDKLNLFYQNMLLKLKELVAFKNTYASMKEKAIIDEIGAAYNLILDAMLPLGYALRTCYFDSLTLLKQTNITFNDLISNKLDTCVENTQLLEIQNFLNCVSTNRNEIYAKICEIGATNPEYFETREENLAKIISVNNQNIVDAFYDSLTSSDFTNILDILDSNDFYKKKDDLVKRRK